MSRAWLAVATLALALVASGAYADGPENVLDRLPGPPSPAVRLERMEGDLEKAYEAELADYDALVTRAPNDVLQQVGRCEFMTLNAHRAAVARSRRRHPAHTYISGETRCQ